eukprot:CAMPEP_0169395678 /NCGR_PEP_ID=MMETSP1017-20121227/50787_1 /TAXON_ID=342587 /ORGANISM="Karlodinium micrum, Strain CCMP2283" /LENGTH=54 /DNA_ID=CAMNT_0009499715 /DNA_START=109 /DNA_END=270 /DNA_ORIENTATION=+
MGEAHHEMANEVEVRVSADKVLVLSLLVQATSAEQSNPTAAGDAEESGNSQELG